MSFQTNTFPGVRGLGASADFAHVKVATQLVAKSGDGYSTAGSFAIDGGGAASMGGAARLTGMEIPNLITGLTDSQVYTQHVGPLMRLKQDAEAWTQGGEAALKASFDTIQTHLEAIKTKADPVEMARIAPPIHNDTYWRDKSSGVSLEEKVNASDTVLLGNKIPQIPDEELGRYLKPEALTAYRARYQDAKFGYKLVLGDLVDNATLRLEFFQRTGKTGMTAEKLESLKAKETKTPIVNVNFADWDGMAADAVNFANDATGKTRYDAMVANQSTAYARVLFLLGRDGVISPEDIALAHHALWLVTGHWSGKDGAWGEAFVRMPWSEVPADIKAIDSNMFRDIADLIEGRE